MKKVLFSFLILSIFSLLLANNVNSIPPSEENMRTFTPNVRFIERHSNRQLNITIIESQSANTGHNMDVRWQQTATDLGHTATILPQTTLDNSDFFETTDILIISSGVIDIPQNRRNIVEQFVQQGGNTYIQSEYQPTYHANQLFQQIVNNTGGDFQWGDTINGNLQPMEVFEPISNTPNLVSQITHFWYGNEGSGNETITPYLEKDGQFFGFIFTAPDDFSGQVITNSDQDWIRESDEWYPLLENHLCFLEAGSVEIHDIVFNPEVRLFQNFPNPFNPNTIIKFNLQNNSHVKLSIYSLKGQLIKELVNDNLTKGLKTYFWDGRDKLDNPVGSGIYFYNMQVDGKLVDTKKMSLIK